MYQISTQLWSDVAVEYDYNMFRIHLIDQIGHSYDLFFSHIEKKTWYIAWCMMLWNP